MKINSQQAERIWKRMLRKYKIKQIDLTGLFQWRKRKLFKGFDKLLERLDDSVMYFEFGNKRYMHVTKAYYNYLQHKEPSSLIALLAHELQHYYQNRTDNMWMTRYLTHTENRSAWEAQAEKAAADIDYFLHKNTSDALAIFNSDWCTFYQVTADDAKQARKIYSRCHKDHEAGRASTVIGGIIINEINREIG